MNEYSDLTAQYIQQRYKLPKIVSKKIEQANRFINDPSSALKLILQKNSSEKKQQRSSQNNISRTARVEAHMKRNSTLQLQDLGSLSSDRELIYQKMRKYKPANGSFSQFYAQQQSIDTNRSHRLNKPVELQNVKLDKIDYFSKQKPSKRKRKHYPSSIELSKMRVPIGANVQSVYLEKLKSIQKISENLRENSRHLLKKADSEVIWNDHSYQKLEDDSNRILTGEQKYILDLEWNDKNSAVGRWNSKH